MGTQMDAAGCCRFGHQSFDCGIRPYDFLLSFFWGKPNCITKIKYCLDVGEDSLYNGGSRLTGREGEYTMLETQLECQVWVVSL